MPLHFVYINLGRSIREFTTAALATRTHRWIEASMALGAVGFLLFALSAATPGSCNSEGDALNAQKAAWSDPNNVLQSWDPTLVNPCTWFHVTCDIDNSVIRVDLENGGVSGPLVPQLALLRNLQYIQLRRNQISGRIPPELGNLTRLVSLDLGLNRLSGPIPPALGQLRNLMFLRLDDNKLSGMLPIEVLDLVRIGNVRVMNLSLNILDGTVKQSHSRGFAIATIIQDPKAQK